VSDKKRARKYKAIENLEDGIKAYLFINAVLENYQDTDHEHVSVARFVAKATLNELLQLFQDNNGYEALKTFAATINNQSRDDDQASSALVQSV